MNWSQAGRPDIQVESYHTLRIPEQHNSISLTVPFGAVQFDIWHHGGYGSLSKTVQVQDGMLIMLDLEPSFELMLQYRDGDRDVLFPGHDFRSSQEVDHLDGTGRVISWGVSGASLGSLSFSQAGRYLIALPDVAGYEPLGRREFTLGPEASKQVQIQLTPRH